MQAAGGDDSTDEGVADDHCILSYGLYGMLAGSRMCCGMRSLGTTSMIASESQRRPQPSLPAPLAQKHCYKSDLYKKEGVDKDCFDPSMEIVLGKPLGRECGPNGASKPSLAEILQMHLMQDLMGSDMPDAPQSEIETCHPSEERADLKEVAADDSPFPPPIVFASPCTSQHDANIDDCQRASEKINYNEISPQLANRLDSIPTMCTLTQFTVDSSPRLECKSKGCTPWRKGSAKVLQLVRTLQISKRNSQRGNCSLDELLRRGNVLTLAKDFSVGDTIGHGSQGRVFTARYSKNGQIVAVKEVLLGRGGSDLERVRREIILSEELRHPRLVHYLGHEFVAPSASNHSARLFLFLEYCSGGSVASHLQMYGPFGFSLLVKYTLQLVEGIAFLHSRKPPVVHRDLKCSNLLFTHGSDLKIGDFGSCKWLLGEAQETHNTFTGTLLWMAPELLPSMRRDEGNASHSLTTLSDVWSLGCCVLEMATAMAPWSERKFDNMFEACHAISQPDALPKLPENLPEVGMCFLANCLDRDPKRRSTALQLLSHKFLVSP